MTPNKIRKLSLHEPIQWGALRSAGEKSLVNGFDSGLELLFGEKLSPRNWTKRFVDFWNGFGAWDELPEKSQNHLIKMHPKVYSEVKSLCYDNTPHTYWKNINNHTLISMGKFSPLSQRAVCKILVDNIKKANLFETEGGHMAPITNPKECLIRHAKFLMT